MIVFLSHSWAFSSLGQLPFSDRITGFYHGLSLETGPSTIQRSIHNGINHGERDLMPQEVLIHIAHLPVLSQLQDLRETGMIHAQKVVCDVYKSWRNSLGIPRLVSLTHSPMHRVKQL